MAEWKKGGLQRCQKERCNGETLQLTWWLSGSWRRRSFWHWNIIIAVFSLLFVWRWSLRHDNIVVGIFRLSLNV